MSQIPRVRIKAAMRSAGITKAQFISRLEWRQARLMAGCRANPIPETRLPEIQSLLGSIS